MDQSVEPKINKSEVLAHSYYREKCEALAQVFDFSRHENSPAYILGTQQILCKAILKFQEEKVECKKQKDVVGLAVTERLILIAKQLMDSIAWRSLSFDRATIQLLSEHQNTGHLDDTTLKDLELAGEIVEGEGSTVLVNDLTSVLRYGDLTIIDNNRVSFHESKYGKAAAQDRRARRQRARLEELTEFLKTGVRVSKDSRALILNIDLIPQSHHAQVQQIMRKAKSDNYCGEIVSGCLAVEAIHTQANKPNFPAQRPFADTDYSVSVDSLMAFTKPTTGAIAPYGIFPLDNESRFDLMSGDVQLIGTLNLVELRRKYQAVGLTLEFPKYSQERAETYVSSSMAEQRKIREDIDAKFVVSDGTRRLSVTLHQLARLALEFLTIETVVEADRQRLNIISTLGVPDDIATDIYTSYGDESIIWQ